MIIYTSPGKAITNARYTRMELSFKEFAGMLRDVKKVSNQSKEFFYKTGTEDGIKYMVLQRVKDMGGYVGGELEDGKRNKQSTLNRWLITLDADYSPDFDILEDSVKNVLPGVNYLIHSTTSSLPGIQLKARIIIELKEPVSPLDYPGLTSDLMGKLQEYLELMHGIGYSVFDVTCIQPERLMFYPVELADTEIEFFELSDGKAYEPIYKPKRVVEPSVTDFDHLIAPTGEYKEPVVIGSEVYEMGEPAGESKALQDVLGNWDKKKDPREAPGLIGAFNRVYDIYKVLELLESQNLYRPGTIQGRFSWVAGTGENGLEIKDDGLIAVAHDHSNPACCLFSTTKQMNAFDFFRIHFFNGGGVWSKGKGAGTESVRETQAAYDSSMSEMMDYLKTSHSKVALAVREELKNSSNWKDAIPRNDKWQVLNIPLTYEMTLENLIDGYKELDGDKFVLTKLPPWRTSNKTPYWTDADDSCFSMYLANEFYIGSPKKNFIHDAVESFFVNRRSCEPREFFRTLPPWDKVRRCETVFSFFLGADDTELNRAYARKMFAAAVRRMKSDFPVKFDNMIVLKGDQGIGKSSFVEKISGNMGYGELQLNNDKKVMYETLRGKWIVEIPELIGKGSTDRNILKSFLSQNKGTYRMSYGRYTVDQTIRQIIIGTFNDDTFLNDGTGNRRFWVVDCKNVTLSPNMRKLKDKNFIAQLWAEACVIEKAGERLYLDSDLQTSQKEANQKFEHFKIPKYRIIQWANMLLPPNWYSLSPAKRKLLYQNYDSLEKGSDWKIRSKANVTEVLHELVVPETRQSDRNLALKIINYLSCSDYWTLNPTRNGNIRVDRYHGDSKGVRRIRFDIPKFTEEELQEEEISTILD